ncbi:IS3 family transposase [Nonomuraea sp. NPDC049709]|uniref:IS3 family transposase n=1 Tax=Nonomuraea sp. NPDC049709 TaxID=3154736 RepID=UPI003431A0A8
MNAFIDAHRDRFGAEPICRVLQHAPSTYCAARSRPPSARANRDEQLKADIKRVYEDNYRCYGVGKMYHQLRRDGHQVARCTVRRLMRELGIQGLVCGKSVCTTLADQDVPRPENLVRRDFQAVAPNRLWVADLTEPLRLCWRLVSNKPGTVQGPCEGALQDLADREGNGAGHIRQETADLGWVRGARPQPGYAIGAPWDATCTTIAPIPTLA